MSSSRSSSYWAHPSARSTKRRERKSCICSFVLYRTQSARAVAVDSTLGSGSCLSVACVHPHHEVSEFSHAWHEILQSVGKISAHVLQMLHSEQYSSIETHSTERFPYRPVICPNGGMNEDLWWRHRHHNTILARQGTDKDVQRSAIFR